jgi:outer membrane protein TolC
VLDLLDAEQELFTSQVSLVRAQRDQVLASYQLKAALGELSITDVDPSMAAYDPTVHYARSRNRLF